MSRFGVTEANPTDKTVSLPFLFRLAAGGLGGAAKKLKGNGFGRADGGAIAEPLARLMFVCSHYHALRA